MGCVKHPCDNDKFANNRNVAGSCRGSGGKVGASRSIDNPGNSRLKPSEFSNNNLPSAGISGQPSIGTCLNSTSNLAEDLQAVAGALRSKQARPSSRSGDGRS